MTLPSQAARSASTARTFTRSRRRRRSGSRGPLMLVVLVVVVLSVGTWVLLGPGMELLTPEGPEAEQPTNPVVTAPPQDALSRPLTPPPNRSWGERGTAPVENRPVASNNADTGTRSATEPPAVNDGTNLTTARRDRGTGSAPSPLAEALDAQNERTQPVPARPIERTEPPREQPAPASDDAVVQAMLAADAEIKRGRPTAARRILDGVVSANREGAGAAQAREALSALNATLLFGPTVYEGEPLTSSYTIQPGDSLSKIAPRQDLQVDWRLIQRVNQISDPAKIQVGQTIKLVKGPFHAIVDKSDYRLDLYQGPANDKSAWRYILSARVGLGESGSTPSGSFVVKEDSRLINPYWVNPRTGERFDKDDPKNPIGERWIGLEGLGADAIKTGYGLHGTIDPGSIGQQKSMGCVRLGERDVELIYELLLPGSLVTISE